MDTPIVSAVPVGRLRSAGLCGFTVGTRAGNWVNPRTREVAPCRLNLLLTGRALPEAQ